MMLKFGFPALAAKPNRIRFNKSKFLKRYFSSSSSTPNPVYKIAFIGLGNMGLPMYQNMVTKFRNPDSGSEVPSPGVSVSVFDISEERRKLAVDYFNNNVNGDKSSDSTSSSSITSVTSATSVEQAADNADIVFTMLFNSQTTIDVYRGTEGSTGGVFGNAKKGALLIDSTTIAPDVAREIGEEGGSLGRLFDVAKEIGEEGASLGFLTSDAPVSGGVTGAAAGTLAFMAGTSQQEIFHTHVTPFLQTMGKGPEGIFYCGKNGTGSIAKVCNNMALAIQMISIAESVNLGKKMGIDPILLANVMNQSSAKCWSSEVYHPCPDVTKLSKSLSHLPSANDYNGGFKVDLMLKDLKLMMENAERVGAKVDFGKRAMELNEEMSVKGGLGGKDFGVVYRYIEDGGKGE